VTTPISRTELVEKREHTLQELNAIWEDLNQTRMAYAPGKVADAMGLLMTRVHELRLVIRGWSVHDTPDFD